MISIRSALTKNLVVRGGCGREAAAAFAQANNINVPSSSSNYNTPTFSVVRYQTSPAYKRYLQKQNGLINAHEHGIQTPSLGVAKTMPNGFSEMENSPLLVIAALGDHNARVEVLKRHIMMIDNVEYEEANTTLLEIEKKNRKNIIWAVLPYQIGIATALTAGIGALPMVFSVDIALWFNHHFVTMEIPGASDLDTALETGAWTWNWMEPVLGTASFTLLCFQFSRAQITNLGLKPYTEKLKEARAKAVIKSFPRYDATILRDFVHSDTLIKKY